MLVRIKQDAMLGEGIFNEFIVSRYTLSSVASDQASKKMDRSNPVCINIDNIEISLEGKLQKLQPLSGDCCIYRVLPGKRKSDQKLYTPQIVSIGPFHYRKQELKAMEEHKRRYLQDFLRRTQVSMKDLLIFIGEKECKLRECYAETIELVSDEFVEMILVDAAFIIELLLRRGQKSNFEELDTVDRILTKPRMITDIRPDLFLLENQLPMFILRDLFEIAKTAINTDNSHQFSMPELIYNLWSWNFLLIEEESIEEHFPEAEHFVDLIRRCLQPSELRPTKLKTLTTPSATELHQAGVQFQLELKSALLKYCGAALATLAILCCCTCCTLSLSHCKVETSDSIEAEPEANGWCEDDMTVSLTALIP
ncbi:hypothetical protein JRO89_XS10G0038700 [Xanthoceras sorbifolium]|uniref:Uncharacterized protein n=1 Tax=Xanthoceras sorbifolium TaxID=99658 RepID=A0ABQ8HHQ4_9ROSI|nr:hypothetical protein JRO89_XS10G0038700 [Xanthoceras sorbifolium]